MAAWRGAEDSKRIPLTRCPPPSHPPPPTRSNVQLEGHPDATVDDPSIQRHPRVDSPSTIGAPGRPHQGIVPGLSDVEQVFTVEKHTDTSELALRERAEEHVGTAR